MLLNNLKTNVLRIDKVGLGPGLVRLCLAFAVFSQHVSRFDFGRVAVMIFFMLSGYWVSRIQVETRRGYLAFEANRVARLWPLLIVAAVFSAFIEPRITGKSLGGGFFSTVSVLGLATRNDDVVGTIWSLDIELQFYLLLPLVLLAMDAARIRAHAFLALSALAALAGATIILTIGTATALFYWPMFAAGLSIFVHRWDVSLGVALASLAALFLGVVAHETVLLVAFSDRWT